jgi:hypothetical protein
MHQQAVFWIRICLFLGLTDPDPSLFCTDTDHSINKQKSKKNFSLMFGDFFMTLTTCVSVPRKVKKLRKYLFFVGILLATEGKKTVSKSGSGSQTYGSTDPDPYQNVTDGSKTLAANMN